MEQKMDIAPVTARTEHGAGFWIDPELQNPENFVFTDSDLVLEYEDVVTVYTAMAYHSTPRGCPMCSIPLEAAAAIVAVGVAAETAPR